MVTTAKPQFVFRVDSADVIGSGHVMRCLTLADALAAREADVHFICRPHPRHLGHLITQRGYPVHWLPAAGNNLIKTSTDTWFGCSIHQDADETAAVISEARLAPDWLILDHYALTAEWEARFAAIAPRMVFDDLADRKRDCELLLNQNMGAQLADYYELLPKENEALLGPEYALLRPQFGRMREQALRKRQQMDTVQTILISLGGMDMENLSSRLIEWLNDMPSKLFITVILSSSAPNVERVKKVAEASHHDVDVQSDVMNVAELMLLSDLAIGAAGSSSWERCSMGLPTMQIVTAANQRFVAERLASAGAVRNLGDADRLTQPKLLDTLQELMDEPALLKTLSNHAAAICDGMGTERVVDRLWRRVEAAHG